MTRILAVLLFATLTCPAVAKNVSSKGYVTQKGTYVAPSNRTSPNKTKVDNYSTKPNVNPYTGKSGTKSP